MMMKNLYTRVDGLMREVVKQSGPQIIIQSATPIQDGLSTEINKKGLSRNIIYLLYIPSILHNKQNISSIIMAIKANM